MNTREIDKCFKRWSSGIPAVMHWGGSGEKYSTWGSVLEHGVNKGYAHLKVSQVSSEIFEAKLKQTYLEVHRLAFVLFTTVLFLC